MLAGCCWVFFSSQRRWSARSGLRATRQAPNLADLLNSTLRPTKVTEPRSLPLPPRKACKRAGKFGETREPLEERLERARLASRRTTPRFPQGGWWPSRTDSIESTIATRRHLPRSLPASACDTNQARIPLSNPSACPAEPGGTHSHPPPAAAPRHPQNRATMDAETIKGACPRPRAKMPCTSATRPSRPRLRQRQRRRLPSLSRAKPLC